MLLFLYACALLCYVCVCGQMQVLPLLLASVPKGGLVEAQEDLQATAALEQVNAAVRLT